MKSVSEYIDEGEKQDYQFLYTVLCRDYQRWSENAIKNIVVREPAFVFDTLNEMVKDGLIEKKTSSITDVPHHVVYYRAFTPEELVRNKLND